jgi:hypothetical protein
LLSNAVLVWNTLTATLRTLGAEHDHSVTPGQDVVNLNAERAVA